jgi:DNA polymerase elongation subunit (family B)
MDAWLFDVYPHPHASGLTLWIKHGERMLKRFVPYAPSFCIKAETRPLKVAERILNEDPRVASTWRDEARLWLRGPLLPVLRVRPHRMQDLRPIATDLRRRTRTKAFLFFDVDHTLECRWMHDRGLFSFCRLETGEKGPELKPASDEDRHTIHYPDPGLKTLRLAVEVEKQGAMPALTDPLTTIRLGEETISVTPPGDLDAERHALLLLGERMKQLDPDVIITRHGDRFDIPYLLTRIRAHRLERKVHLGRDSDPAPDEPDQAATSLHTYGRWIYKTNAYYLRGRWHIDLSKKALDAEDDRQDLHGILYLTRVSSRRAQDVNRNGAGYSLQQMQVDLAKDQGVALPWKRNLSEDWKDAATLCAVDRGGQIMNPEPGIHEDVAACDFSGYYPSLVVRHNLSSDSINCTCCPDGPLIPELGYHVCTKHYGHQAEVLRRLWPHRRYVKAILRRAEHSGDVPADLVAKCRAIKSEHKALGVVCFGYFRYRNARFGCAEVHQAIQCYGRAGMTRAREIALREGYETVHMLTDCMFLHRPGITRNDALKIARRIGKEVGVPMDVEGVYRWLVLLPSKTHSTASVVGVPTRYYGKFADGRIKVRGIEVQRHSTPDWIYETQQAMLDVFQEADDATGFLKRIPRALETAKDTAEALRKRKVSAKELGIMVQATRNLEEYAANTRTKSALKRLLEGGTERNLGEYVKYVIARSDGPFEGRALPVEVLEEESPWFPVDAPRVYDVDAYLRLLARSVETLLAPFGYEEEALYRWFSGRGMRPGMHTSQQI